MQLRTWITASAFGVLLAAAAAAQAPKPAAVPAVVTPSTSDKPAAPPSDAIVLFDGRNLDQWVATKDKAPAGWTVADGLMVVKKSAGNIETKRKFRNYQLHLEWRVPENVTGSGQLRANSGIFLASTGPDSDGYELQILDSYRNETHANGQAGAIYNQHPPLVNAMRPPGQWQTYDVVWTAPVFAPDGRLLSPARVTAFHNGLLIQNDTVVLGETAPAKPVYRAHGASPIKLQAHGDPFPPPTFRNIWVRELGSGR